MSEEAQPNPAGAIDRPLTVAHRAANSIGALREADALGVDLLEADVWLHRGRLEVRHLKTLGRVPLLWDRWRLVGAWSPRLLLTELLATGNPQTPLLIDLKGRERGLPEAVANALEEWRPGAPYAVSSQRWALLDLFLERSHVRVLHSVGKERQFAELPGRLASHPTAGIGVHHELLSEGRVAELRELSDTLLTWTINSEARCRQLLDWGVTGIISDRLGLLQAILARGD